MDLKGWEGWIGAGLLAVLTFIFGHQKYKREQSKDDLADAANSVSANYVASIDKQYDRAILQRDEAMQQAKVNLDMYLAEKKYGAERDIEIMEHKYQIKRLEAESDKQKRQLHDLAKIMARYRPEVAGELEESGFAPLL